MIGEKKLKEEKSRMKALNKIDGLVGSRDVGMIIDSFNEEIDRRKENDFNKEISARNEYFLPLWKRAIEEMRSDIKPTPKKKSKKSYIINEVPKLILP